MNSESYSQDHVQPSITPSSHKNTLPHSKPTYIQKQENEEYKSMLKLIQLKQNQSQKKRFQFFGEPQPPTIPLHQQVKSYSSLPIAGSWNSDTTKSQDKSVTIINETYSAKVGHLHVKKFESSILSIQGHSLNLSNGLNSILVLKCNGPILVHDINYCIVVILQCQQARFHNSSNCIVFMAKNETSGDSFEELKDAVESGIDTSLPPLIVENCAHLRTNQMNIENFNHPSRKFRDPTFQSLDANEKNSLKEVCERADLADLASILRRYGVINTNCQNSTAFTATTTTTTTTAAAANEYDNNK